MPAKQAPGAAKPKARKRPAARSPKAAPVVAAQTATAPAAPTTLEEIETMLVAVRIRLREPDLSATAHAKLSAEIRGLLKLRSAVERDMASAEDALSRAPAFIQLAAEITEVVAACPQCGPKLVSKMSG